MIKLEFGIVHRGCLVNEMSRALPGIKLDCPGGFIVSPTSADEIICIDRPSDADVNAVVDFFTTNPSIVKAELLERTPAQAFVRLVTRVSPDNGYCSEVVAKNRGFRLGTELQHGGIEQWRVGCYERSQAEAILEDLAKLGDVTYHRVSEGSWVELVAPH